MRYNLFKVSKTRHLLISESQRKGLDIANFNIFSLPGAEKNTFTILFPRKRFIISLSCLLAVTTYLLHRQKILSDRYLILQISQIKAKKVFVVSILLRHSQPHQAKEVKSFLSSRQEGWKFREISRQVFSNKHLKEDNVPLNSNALRGVTYILKGKILYNKHCPEIEKEGHLKVIVWILQVPFLDNLVLELSASCQTGRRKSW